MGGSFFAYGRLILQNFTCIHLRCGDKGHKSAAVPPFRGLPSNNIRWHKNSAYSAVFSRAAHFTICPKYHQLCNPNRLQAIDTLPARHLFPADIRRSFRVAIGRYPHQTNAP